MNRRHRTGIWMASAALIFSGAALAQEPPPGPGGPGGRHHGAGAMEFGRFEMGLMGKTVTGAPYSAQIVTQRNQTLSDGTHIAQQSTGAVYRDTAGRVRREMNMQALGSLTESGKAPHAVFISDPVAGVHYVLHPDAKTADRMPAPPNGASPKERESRPSRNGVQVATESLGTQTIEGVNAEGTRIIKTIPAGTFGNDKAIQITVERWFSPDLQTVVLIKRSDPWMGESTMKLTNISRTEPASSLFSVPADYTVQDRPAPHGFAPRGAGAPRQQD